MGIRWLRLDIEDDRDDNLDDLAMIILLMIMGMVLMTWKKCTKEKEVSDYKKIKSQSLLS